MRSNLPRNATTSDSRRNRSVQDAVIRDEAALALEQAGADRTRRISWDPPNGSSCFGAVISAEPVRGLRLLVRVPRRAKCAVDGIGREGAAVRRTVRDRDDPLIREEDRRKRVLEGAVDTDDHQRPRAMRDHTIARR